MLFVETELKPSSIHGIGLFAAEPIEKGTIVWEFTPGFDRRYDRQQLVTLSPTVKAFLSIYGWVSRINGDVCCCTDNARFFNHDQNANCLSEIVPGVGEVITRAVRDIAIGEELTDDYASFDAYFTPSQL